MPNWAATTFAATLCFIVPAASAESTEAFTTTESGLKYAITERGTGRSPMAGQVIIAAYRGTLADGKEFDSSYKRGQPFAFTLGKGQVIKGWDEGFRLLRVGDKATLIVPPNLAYGNKGRPNIPPNSTLTFEVEVLALKDHALADMLEEVINSGGIDAARRRLNDLKAAKFPDYYVSESQLNGLGYRYLTKDKFGEAIAVFRWNAELFPESANVHDSLAEAYGKSGDQILAKESCRRALVIDPDAWKAQGSWCTPAKASR